jgi:hypothetical protein
MIKGSGETIVRALFTGVATAAIAGLLLGGMMKPNLRGDERPQGPQIFTGWSGERSTGPFDPGMTFADYQGRVPDYVIGTDWQAFAWQDEVAYEPAPTRDFYEETAAEAPRAYAEMRLEEPPRNEPLYPSISGGVAYDVNARAAAAPAPRSDAAEHADLDEEAPPEATGDTSPAV